MYLDKVKEFMLTFGQPVLDKPTELPEDRNKLRISLILEELIEYAEASGLKGYICNEMYNKSQQPTLGTERDIINQIEQLDALLDLQYVLSGAVHEHGFSEIFDKGFNEVHRSNMSKACLNQDQIDRTFDFYDSQNEGVLFEEINGKHIVKRTSDLKVLKCIDYSPANLKKFLNND